MSINTTIPTASDYRDADRAGKAKIRSDIAANMRRIMDGIADGSIENESGFAEYALWRAAESVCIGSNTRTVVVPDYNALASVRVATLRRAADMIEMGATRPNGLDDEIELVFDSSAVADESAATAIASEPIVRGSYNALGGDDGAIAEFAVPMMTVGVFYTSTEIAHMVEKSSPAYADRRCSPGAVTNALASEKSPVPNVTYVPRTDTTRHGGIRTA
jgi:hypothetical protein